MEAGRIPGDSYRSITAGGWPSDFRLSGGGGGQKNTLPTGNVFVPHFVPREILGTKKGLRL